MRKWSHRPDLLDSEYVDEMRDRESEMEAELQRLRHQLEAHDACRCDPYWCPCSEPFCDAPQRPWIDDAW